MTNEPPTPETTLREGVPCRRVRLADGREWGLSLPTVRLTPGVTVTPDDFGRLVERISVAVGFGYPFEVRERIDEVRAACECGAVPEQYAAFFSLAALLLRRAHDIDLPTACRLLAVSDEELPGLVGAVLGVVSGGGEGTADGPRGATTK